MCANPRWLRCSRPRCSRMVVPAAGAFLDHCCMNNNRSTFPPVRTPVVPDSTGDLAAGRRGRHLLAPLALITLALAGSALRSGSEQSRPTDVAASGLGSTRLMDGLAGEAGQARQWAGTLVMGLPALAM